MTIAGKCSPVGGSKVSGTSPLTFTGASTGPAVPSNVRILWDLDNDGDFSSAVEDITPYVMSGESVTGRDSPSNLTGRAGPGKLRLNLNNTDNRFSAWNTSSPLTADPYSLRTGRRIRVQTTDGALGGSLITYVGIGAAAVANNASVTPALPTGLQAADPSIGQNADLMLILASIRNSGTGSVISPTGWAPLMQFGNVALLGRYYITGDTAPTVTFANGVANATTLAQCFAFRGCHQTLGHVVSASATLLNGVVQDVTVPSLTVAEDNNALVVCGWKQAVWTGASTLSGQGLTEIADVPSSLGDDASHAIDYKIETTATNFTTTSFVVTGGVAAISRGLAFALRPAVDQTDPVLLVRDRFDRPTDTSVLDNDELGTPWAVRANGGYGVHGGTASAQTGRGAVYNADIVETIDTGRTDHYVQATIPMQVQDGRIGLIVRYVDINNYTRAFYSTLSRGFYVEDVKAGVVTNLAGGGVFAIEGWDNMTMGLGVAGQIVTLYLGGTPLLFAAPLQLSRDNAGGTSVGIYGKWQSHSDVPPAVGDFHAWDRVRAPIDGVLWTGTVKSLKTTVSAGAVKVVTLEAEGPLASAAGSTVAAPRITRTPGEFDTGVNHSVPAGAVIGDIMARAGLLHPPHPLPTNPVSHLGPHAVADAKALEMSRQVELSEFGFIKETQEGAVAFEDRDYRAAVSPRAWFTDTPGTGQYPYSDIEPFDQQNEVVNQAVAQVAATCPTIVSVEHQSDDANPLSVAITMPATSPGQLVLVCIACSADAAGKEFGAPPPWKEHRALRQAEGNGMRVYSLVADGSEQGATVYFYKGSSQGTFVAQIYVIDNWYGTDDGLKMGRVSSGIWAGIDAYPISPGWSRAPALYILFQIAIGANTGILWGPLDWPPPIGYDYDALDGLVQITTPVAFETGIESVFKFDVLDTENPGPWRNVFQDYLLLESVVFAVRGSNGPLTKPTIDSPTATGGQGQVVAVDDTASQLDHNFVRSNPTVPLLLYTEGDARGWCDAVIAEFSDDRPIITISFTATKNTALRSQAMRRRVSDRVTVTATGNAGLGFEQMFTIESVHHAWAHGMTSWVTTYELSPA